eukprot:GFUD01003231.1.p1 GENE.GFUD01003231.1~~GFUD01003231.1.p1  ORF type:complete len:621 (-),score=171.92 GFUD01003231.1:623-2485(-)
MQFQEIMSMDPMFPPRARKCASSLYTCAKKVSTRLLVQFINSSMYEREQSVRKVRKYIRQSLPAVILTDILSSMVPVPSDKWRFPCAATLDRLHCKMHPECELVYGRLDRVIRVMFSEDISQVSINLKTVNIDLYKQVIASLTGVMTKLPSRPFPLLTSLVVCGGSVHSDDIITRIEELCEVLKDFAGNIENLHLPVASNLSLRSVSDIRRIRSLRADRTKAFNKRGLYHLCHPESHSRAGLQVLHLGVFKHTHFEKQDVAEFLKCMKNLLEFSLLDSDRALVRLDGSCTPGDKVLTYSVFKRAMRDTEESASIRGQIGPHLLATNLRAMSVVDRSLKPHYILESASLLHRLSIDWQQELSFPPFNRFKSTWFTDMMKGQSWVTLSKRLTRLDITFPAAYSINSYSLPLEDYTRLMQNLANLEELRLVGAGQGGPIPLMPTLQYCPKLRDLVLEKCPVHVPDNYEVVDQRFVSHSLKRFFYLGEMSSLLVHDFMMRGISHYMPALTELEIQPQTVLGYCGLRPDQVLELSSLMHLEKLSLPLSIRECIMNLPQIIFVLREFPSLRFLTLSWGMWCESYDISRGKISYMMAWLFNALGAENANIHLELSYKQHPREFCNFV